MFCAGPIKVAHYKKIIELWDAFTTNQYGLQIFIFTTWAYHIYTYTPQTFTEACVSAKK
jgi:hypothetical protein